MEKWLKLFVFVLIGFGIAFNGPEMAFSKADKDKTTKKQKTLEASSLRCRYKVGNTQRIRITNDKSNKVWVEMPDKPSTQTGMNETTREIVLRTSVESVDKDGSAIVKVTFEKVNLKTTSDVRKKKKTNEYYSDSKKTKSDWPNEPKLSGETYKIKVAPDTTVMKIMGLDELNKKLKISPDKRSIAGALISEKEIKDYHQRDFVRFSPESVSAKGESSYEKNLPIPNVMIKAKAIKKKYVCKIEKKGKSQIATVVSTAEPLHVLPQGLQEPEQPNDFGRTIIKKMSDMNELKVIDRGCFDLNTRTVLSETKDVDCTLLLLEENVGFGASSRKDKKKSGGTMFTQVKMSSKYEVIK